MLTKASSVNEFIRLGKKYRDTYIEVLEDNDGYTVIVYCDVKPDDEVRLFKEFNRLIACIGMENVEYEDETIGMDGERITGKVELVSIQIHIQNTNRERIQGKELQDR